jgi:hypothetical protein
LALSLSRCQVYSTQALAALAEARGDGTVACPATGAVFPLASVRAVYIL